MLAAYKLYTLQAVIGSPYYNNVLCYGRVFVTASQNVITCETLAEGEKSCQIGRRRKNCQWRKTNWCWEASTRGASDTFAEILRRFQRRPAKEVKRAEAGGEDFRRPIPICITSFRYRRDYIRNLFWHPFFPGHTFAKWNTRSASSFTGAPGSFVRALANLHLYNYLIRFM